MRVRTLCVAVTLAAVGMMMGTGVSSASEMTHGAPTGVAPHPPHPCHGDVNDDSCGEQSPPPPPHHGH
jgi:hypothetical protein